MENNELRIKEYERLTKEIGDTLVEISSIEKFSILSTGAIFTWLLTNGEEFSEPKFAYFLPALIVLLFGLMVYSMGERIKFIGKYIKENIESSSQMQNVGWEGYLSDYLLKEKISALALSRYLLWGIHLSVNIALAFYLLSIK